MVLLEIDISTIIYGVFMGAFLLVLLHQYLQIKPKLISALESVPKAERALEEQADKFHQTLVETREQLQEQIRDNVGVVMGTVEIKLAQVQSQVNAHVETMNDTLKRQVVSVNANLKESIGEVKKSIDVASSTGPVASVIGAAKDFWNDPWSALVIGAGCGLLARQIYVKYVKNKEGKEGIERLSQSKILTLFDAMLAMFIAPTMLTHGWQYATMLWKAAKTAVEAIRTMVMGINMYQDLFGDDLKNRALPDLDDKFDTAIEMVESRIDQHVEKVQKEGKEKEAKIKKNELKATKEIRVARHDSKADFIQGFHKCNDNCGFTVINHDPKCEDLGQGWCGCQARQDLIFPENKYHKYLTYKINSFPHYSECTFAGNLAKEIEDNMNNSEAKEIIMGLLLEVEGSPMCDCYGDVSSNSSLMSIGRKLRSRDGFVLKAKIDSPVEMAKHDDLRKLWVDVSDTKPMIGKEEETDESSSSSSSSSTIALIGDDKLEDFYTNLKIQQAIKKHEGKKMEQMIREEFNLPSTGFGDRASYMFNYVKNKPALIPVVVIVVFAILLFMSWLLGSPEKKKPWYNDKIKPYVMRTRSQYKKGKDVTKADAVLTKWAKEGKASDAKRAAARLLAKASTRRKRPWWDYDDEREFDDDETLYDSEPPSDRDEDEDDFGLDYIEDLEDAILEEEHTVAAIKSRYGKLNDYESKDSPLCCTEDGCPKVSLPCRGWNANEWSQPVVISPKVESAEQVKKEVSIDATKLTSEASKLVKKEVRQCPLKSEGGCTLHLHGKNACKYNIKDCPNVNCYRKHTPCSRDKYNVCLNKDHYHVPITKKPKVENYSLQKQKKEAIHNGDRMVMTAQMINSVGWAICPQSKTELNATKIWTGFYVSAHIFGETRKVLPDDCVEVEFRDKEGKIQRSTHLYKDAKHIGYDSIYWNLKFIQNDFKNKGTEPKLGEKLTMVAYDSHDDFVKGKPRQDIAPLLDIVEFTEEDNLGYKGKHKRCLLKNSTVSGNCGAPYYNAHGYVVGFHNAKLQDRNIFIGIDKNMTVKAANSQTF